MPLPFICHPGDLNTTLGTKLFQLRWRDIFNMTVTVLHQNSLLFIMSGEGPDPLKRYRIRVPSSSVTIPKGASSLLANI